MKRLPVRSKPTLQLRSPSRLPLRRIATTTALATGVIAGLMLFQPNEAVAQSTWNGAGSAYGTSTNWTPNTVATGGVGGIFDDTGAAAPIVDLGAATFTPSTIAINGATAYTIQNGTLTISTSFTNSSSANQTVAAILDGAGTLTQSGTGTLTLTGVNTLSGTTTVSSGQLSVTGLGTLGSTVVNVTGGTLLTDGGALAAGATATVSGTGTFTATGAEAFTAITQSGGTVDGSGSHTLTGAFTQSGGTTGGTVVINAATFTQSGGATIAAGTTVTSAGAQSLQAGTIAGTLDGAGAITASVGTTTVTSTGVISNTASLTVASGTLILQGANTYTTATTVNSGAVLNIQNAAALGTTGVGTTVNSGGALELQGGVIFNAEPLSIAGTGIAGGGALRNVSGTNTFSGPITLAGNATIASAVGSSLILSGGMALGASTLTIGTGAVTIATVAITGVGGSIVVNNGGTLAVDIASSYSGGTTVNTGGNVVASVAGALGSGTVTLAGGGLVGNAASVTLANAIVLTANGSVTNLQAGQSLTLTGGINLNGNTLTFNDNNAANTATVSTTAITGTGGITKSGASTLILSGANSYSGTTVISGGVLNIQNATALGVVAGGVVVASGAALQIQGGIVVGAEALNLSGTGLANDGALRNISGANSYAGAVTLATASRINSDAGSLTLSGGITGGFGLTVGGAGDTTISGIIGTGANTLTKDGAGNLTLSGANTYTGITTVSAGTLSLSGGAAIADAGAVTIDTTGAVLNVAAAETIGSLAGVAGTGLTLAATLTTGGNNGATTFAGAATGAGGLTKQGTGLFILSGASTYTGATTVNAGELRVNGSLGATAVAVNNTATLSGIGSIAGAVTINNGGTLSAGQSPGTLTVGSLTLNAGSNSIFELNTPFVSGGATNDLIVSNGAVQLGGTLTATAASAGFYRLINVNAGGVTGAFATINVAGFASSAVYVNSPGASSQVNLVVLAAGQTLLLWDGSDFTGNGTVDGGNGTWNSTNTNWTGAAAGVNGAWQSSVGVFQGAAGTVTVQGTQLFDTLQFNTDGYVLNGGQLGFSVAAGGTLNISGGVTTTINSVLANGTGSALTKVGAGTLNLGGVNTFTGGTSVNAGTLGLLAGGVLASNVTVGSGATFNNAGTVNASVTNSGALTTSGTITGNVTNTAGASASGTIGGSVTNSGTFTVTGALSGIGTLTNSGAVIVGANSLSAATIANLASFTTTGAVRATTLFDNRFGATTEARGAITSPLVQNNGTFNTTGKLDIAGAFTNLPSGVLTTSGGTLGISGALTNSGRVTIGENLVANLGSLSNAGTVVLGRGASIGTTAGVANTGLIDLRNGATNNLITVGGGWSGNGRVGLDLDIVNAAADRIVVNGLSSGTTSVDFAQLTATSFVLNRDILVVDGARGAQFVANGGLPASGPSPFPNGAGQLLTNNGLIQYWFGEATPGSGTYVVRPDLNVAAASGFVASVSSALSSINAFSEPASAFISGPTDPQPNTFSIGSWGRTRGGHFDITSNSNVTSLGGVSRSFRSVNEAGFSGFQLGIDAGLYNINGTGWTANLGVHGGKVDAKVTSPDTRLDVEQPFYGLYAAVRNNSGFAFDVLMRRDDFDLKLNSQSAGLSNTKFKADGWSGLASVTQRFNITDSIYIDPSVALLYSRAEVDSVRALSATVAWQPIESVTGRFGVQIGTFFQPTETIVVAPYLAASVWREFAGKTKAEGQFSTLTFPTTTDRVGTYGQVSAGFAVSSTTPGLSGFVRGDLRFGDRIEGYALNGGLRYQF